MAVYKNCSVKYEHNSNFTVYLTQNIILPVVYLYKRQNIFLKKNIYIHEIYKTI